MSDHEFRHCGEPSCDVCTSRGLRRALSSMHGPMIEAQIRESEMHARQMVSTLMAQAALKERADIVAFMRKHSSLAVYDVITDVERGTHVGGADVVREEFGCGLGQPNRYDAHGPVGDLADCCSTTLGGCGHIRMVHRDGCKIMGCCCHTFREQPTKET